MTDQQVFVTSLRQMGAEFTELTLPQIIFGGEDAPDFGAYMAAVHNTPSAAYNLPEFDTIVIFGPLVLHFFKGSYVGRLDQSTRLFTREGGVAISP